jgi:carboxyl-terminal processing protease
VKTLCAACLFLLLLASPSAALAVPSSDAELAAIMATVRREAEREVSAAELARAGLAGLRRVLPGPVTPAAGGGPEGALQAAYRAASEAWPELARQGVFKRAVVEGMLSCLEDPYAAWFSPEDYARVRGSLGAGKYGTLGLYVVRDQGRGPVEVVEVVEGSPAWQAGLRSGDRVARVDGHDLAGLSLEEARGCLSGPPGQTAVLVLADGRSVRLEHARLEVPCVESRLLSHGGLRVACLRVRSFGVETPAQMGAALDQMEAQGAEAAIVDLRNDGGGYLWSALEVCSRFLAPGRPIVTVWGRRQAVTYRALGGTPKKIPLVVLINENTASAAEITAAALREQGSAWLLGSRSFGKGSVQKFLVLGDGSALRLTAAHYRTPTGLALEGRGLAPDISVPMPPGLVGTDQDVQLSRALQILAAGKTARAP